MAKALDRFGTAHATNHLANQPGDSHDSLRADVVSFARASDASLLARMFAFMRGLPLMLKCPKEKRPYGLRYLTEQLLHSCRPRFFLSRPICHDSAVGVSDT
jgi:hypothetical protein